MPDLGFTPQAHTSAPLMYLTETPTRRHHQKNLLKTDLDGGNESGNEKRQ